MPPKSVRAVEVLQVAEKFRVRAAETQNTAYHHLMLQTARELEDQAERLELDSDQIQANDDTEATT